MDSVVPKSVYVDAKYRIMEAVSIVHRGNESIVFRAKKANFLLIRRLVAALVTCNVLLLLALMFFLWVTTPMRVEPGLWWRIVILVLLFAGPNILLIRRAFRGKGSINSTCPKETDGLTIWKTDESRMLVEFTTQDSMELWFQARGIEMPRCSAQWQPSVVADIQVMLFAAIIILSATILNPFSGNAPEATVLRCFVFFGFFIAMSAVGIYHYFWSSRRMRSVETSIKRFLAEIRIVTSPERLATPEE